MALSDPSGTLASPLAIIDRSDEKQDIGSITAIINQYHVKRIIVGLPRSMDGSLGRQAEKVEAFTRELCRRTGIPTEYRDERLTTVVAKRLLRTVRTKKIGKRVRDDAVAAALILQGYLDEGHD